MPNKNKNNIIPQMFDVRPVDQRGNFDLEKIERLNLARKSRAKDNGRKLAENNSDKIFTDIKKPAINAGRIVEFKKSVANETREAPIISEAEYPKEIFIQNLAQENNYFDEIAEEQSYEYYGEKQQKFKGLIDSYQFLKENPSNAGNFGRKRYQTAFSFAGIAVVIFMAIFGTGFIKKGLQIKGLVMDNGKKAYVDLAQAQEEILNKNFQGSQSEFNSAYNNFDEISKELNNFGGIMVETVRYIPYLSKLSTGAVLAETGKDISRAGVLAGQIMQTLNGFKNPLEKIGNSDENAVSLLKIFQDTDKNIKEIQSLLADAQEKINEANVADIPSEQQPQFINLKNKLPEINKFLAEFVNNSQIFTDVLGGNGPRKYLFLFQNNQEMRATGGFIGTYGVLDIFNGRVRSFFIDGIFNPDGQLREKVIPPIPIQKISAAWSLHDSNWFPNFPVSAEKAAWFYEKTGGPTVDGVITMTPAVMQKFLGVTGSIEMPEYGLTIDKDNFLEKVQQEVEVDYDKELNQPKKILADLAPKILDKIFNAGNLSDIAKTANILTESLNEKQILIYSKNYDIEKRLSELGWSGEILDTQKDYLSIINTNINGFKTDGMVEEKIEHSAEIQADGSVIDTITIIRHHNGGNEKQKWLNKVNANYMRVYVPKGSQLLSAEGQTREFNSPPLDYKALGFKNDPQVKMEEEAMKIDEDSGTRVYEDAGKTVFANWVYVSPQETVQIKYKYLLPFKIDLNEKDKIINTYSLLAQKQSGSVGSQFVSNISFPDNYEIKWKYPNDISQNGNNLKVEADLKTDKFVGVAFVPSEKIILNND